MSDWNDHVVGDRMAVDQEFSGRVQASSFSSQEWGLIMTATEFEIRDPGTDRAQIVANTENLPQMMPELENVRKQMPTGGGDEQRDSSGGMIDNLKDAIGLGGGDDVDQERLEAAQQLTQEYADEFQAHLEEHGKWERVQKLAMSDDSPEDGEAAPDDQD